jgi:hypothetical protein
LPNKRYRGGACGWEACVPSAEAGGGKVATVFN